MPEPTLSRDTDLRAFISPLYQRRWLILAIVVIATAATYLISAGRVEKFTAGTKVNVQGSELQELLGAPTNVNAARNAQNQAQIVGSKEVALAVIRQLHLDESPTSLLKTVSATAGSESDIISIEATRPSAAGAAAVANGFARQYIRLNRAFLNAQVDASIDGAERQLRQLPVGPASAQQRQDLRAAIGSLQAATAVASGQAQQIDRATPPSKPSSPKPQRDAAFALAISLVLSCALALALARFDRRIRRVEDVSGLFGMPLLAVLPHSKDPLPIVGRRRVVLLPGDMREAFRALRTNLMLSSLDRPLKRILVTSAIQGEGKSMLTRNLAVAYAEWGHRVALVDADLRRGTLTKMIGSDQHEHGFTSVLTGEVSLADALVEIPVDVDEKAIAMLGEIRGGGAPGAKTVVREGRAGISLLPAGVALPNPQAVLAAQSAHALIDELAESFDLVLIDTSPVLAVSDALPLLAAVDGSIVMTRIGLTTRDAVSRFLDTLGQIHDAKMLGVVVDDLQPEPGSRYGYGYGYGYSGSRGV